MKWCTNDRKNPISLLDSIDISRNVFEVCDFSFPSSDKSDDCCWDAVLVF
jgi:hypothetical protein